MLVMNMMCSSLFHCCCCCWYSLIHLCTLYCNCVCVCVIECMQPQFISHISSNLSDIFPHRFGTRFSNSISVSRRIVCERFRCFGWYTKLVLWLPNILELHKFCWPRRLCCAANKHNNFVFSPRSIGHMRYFSNAPLSLLPSFTKINFDPLKYPHFSGPTMGITNFSMLVLTVLALISIRMNWFLTRIYFVRSLSRSFHVFHGSIC